MIEEFLPLAIEAGKALWDLVSSARAASAEEMAALKQRLADALTTMRGERELTHAEVDARTKALQDELDALKAKP